jgi:hypothetical protein
VRVVALDAVHAAFQDWMVLGKMELSLEIQVALKTSRRVFARIDDESFAAAQASRGDMLAAGTVTGFASALAGHRRTFRMNPRVRAGRKPSHNVRMTIRARLVADEMRAGDFQRRNHLGRGRGTRNDQQRGRGRNPKDTATANVRFMREVDFGFRPVCDGGRLEDLLDDLVGKIASWLERSFANGRWHPR